MKPHEETWEHDGSGDLRLVNAECLLTDVIAPFGHDFDRCELAAQAPAMARVLLKVEWAGRRDYVGDGGYECCSSCGGIAPDNEQMSDAVDDLKTGRTVVGHRVDCSLVAVLRAAGVTE